MPRRLALAAVLLALSVATVACQVRLPGAPGCPIFPDDSIWHADVSKLPVDPRSSSYIAAIGESAPLKADFGSGLWDGGPIGIPVRDRRRGHAEGLRRLRLRRRERRRALPDPRERPDRRWRAERRRSSCPARRQGLVHALRAVRRVPATTMARWHAGSGAIWNLTSNALRPDGVDLRRRGRAPDPARARPLRRDRGWRDHARDPRHGAAARSAPLRLAGSPRREQPDRSVAAADGAAVATEAGRRHHRLSAASYA